MAQFKPNVGAATPSANAPSANVDAAKGVAAKQPAKPAPRKSVKAAAPNAPASKVVLPKLPTKAAPLVVPAELKAAIAKVNPKAQPAPAPLLAMPPVTPEAPLAAAVPVSAPAVAVEPAPEPVAAAPEPAQPDLIAPAPVEAEATSNEPIIDSPNQTFANETLKETPMATEFNAIPSDTMTTAVSDVQAKLQTAYDKSAGMVAEMSEMAKGNVEAIVESTKLFAAGVQDLSKSYAEEAKSAYETATADIKEMSAIKSPTELFQLQGKILRRNFENLIAATSKSTDAALKLANEAMAPISGRVNVATEKLSKIAA